MYRSVYWDLNERDQVKSYADWKGFEFVMKHNLQHIMETSTYQRSNARNNIKNFQTEVPSRV